MAFNIFLALTTNLRLRPWPPIRATSVPTQQSPRLVGRQPLLLQHVASPPPSPRPVATLSPLLRSVASLSPFLRSVASLSPFLRPVATLSPLLRPVATLAVSTAGGSSVTSALGQSAVNLREVAETSADVSTSSAGSGDEETTWLGQKILVFWGKFQALLASYQYSCSGSARANGRLSWVVFGNYLFYSGVWLLMLPYLPLDFALTLFPVAKFYVAISPQKMNRAYMICLIRTSLEYLAGKHWPVPLAQMTKCYSGYFLNYGITWWLRHLFLFIAYLTS